jgi:hypothetical protein
MGCIFSPDEDLDGAPEVPVSILTFAAVPVSAVITLGVAVAAELAPEVFEDAGFTGALS